MRRKESVVACISPGARARSGAARYRGGSQQLGRGAEAGLPPGCFSAPSRLLHGFFPAPSRLLHGSPPTPSRFARPPRAGPRVSWQRCRDTRRCCGNGERLRGSLRCPAGTSGSRIPGLSGQAFGTFGKAWRWRPRAAPRPWPRWSWRCGSCCSWRRAREVSGRLRPRDRLEKEVKLKFDFKQENSLILICFLNSLSSALTLVILNSKRVVNASS